jgi:hypothetical protein
MSTSSKEVEVLARGLTMWWNIAMMLIVRRTLRDSLEEMGTPDTE